jgi:alpha-L-rhamnosidase
MAPTVRALAAGGRDDVLWDLLQEDDQPSYGYFMASTPANPGGMTTIGERWNRGDSKNHMILAQIDEWFQTGLGGIRPGATAYRSLTIHPKPVGDLRHAHASYETPQGVARSGWQKNGDRFELTVTVPANTVAEVWLPTGDGTPVAPARARFLRVDGDNTVYSVPSGQFTFRSH